MYHRERRTCELLSKMMVTTTKLGVKVGLTLRVSLMHAEMKALGLDPEGLGKQVDRVDLKGLVPHHLTLTEVDRVDLLFTVRDCPLMKPKVTQQQLEMDSGESTTIFLMEFKVAQILTAGSDQGKQLSELAGHLDKSVSVFFVEAEHQGELFHADGTVAEKASTELRKGGGDAGGGSGLFDGEPATDATGFGDDPGTDDDAGGENSEE